MRRAITASACLLRRRSDEHLLPMMFVHRHTASAEADRRSAHARDAESVHHIAAHKQPYLPQKGFPTSLRLMHRAAQHWILNMQQLI